LVWLPMAAITRTNTRIGATAFSAEMNRSPRMATESVAAGASSASAMPRTRPMAIWPMRLMRSSRRRKPGVPVVVRWVVAMGTS